VTLAACQPDGGMGDGRTSGPDGPRTSQPTPGGGTVAEPNVIAGRVTTEDGRPISTASLRIVGYTGGASLGQHIETVTTGADGTYRYEVPNGLYEVLGQATVDFEGQTYLFDLDPADGSCDQQLSDDGIVKDFVLRLTGLIMCFDGVDPDNYLFYHGATIQLSSGLASAAPHDIVEYTLAPLGPLADGSSGTTLTMQRTVAAHSTSFGPLDQTWVLYDIPLAQYDVSAALLAGGQRIPLLVSTDAAPTPEASVEVSFDPKVVVGTLSSGYSALIPALDIHDGG
jgi:hypothetical protein